MANESRVTQIVGEVLQESSGEPNARVTQVVIEVLRPSTSPTEIVCDFGKIPVPTVNCHRFATCWKIERLDGTIFRFTDHNMKLTVQSQVYTPVNSFLASAREAQSQLESINVTAEGVVSSSSMAVNNMIAGFFREAEVTEFVVDWNYPWAGIIICNIYIIESLTFDGERWVAEFVGQAKRLTRQVGHVYSRNCRYTLGDSKCTVDLSTDGFTSATISVTAVTTDFESTRFTATTLTDDDKFWAQGTINWVTGLNAGVDTEVKTWTKTGAAFILAIPTPFDIAASDTFIVIAGCDKSQQTCITKFDNNVNHGGFPNIPGPDKVLHGPSIEARGGARAFASQLILGGL
jgi:uncharacterized phage protein (TIGR02218 family)